MSKFINLNIENSIKIKNSKLKIIRLYLQILPHRQETTNRSDGHAGKNNDQENLSEIGNVIVENIETYEKAGRHFAQPESDRVKQNKRDKRRDKSVKSASHKKRSTDVAGGSSDQTHYGNFFF